MEGDFLGPWFMTMVELAHDRRTLDPPASSSGSSIRRDSASSGASPQSPQVLAVRRILELRGKAPVVGGDHAWRRTFVARYRLSLRARCQTG